jgi:hypothetical protein
MMRLVKHAQTTPCLAKFHGLRLRTVDFAELPLTILQGPSNTWLQTFQIGLGDDAVDSPRFMPPM